MAIRTQEEVSKFLWDIQWSRFNKKELQQKLDEFFGVKVTIKESTDKDFKEVDYSFDVTTAQEPCACENYVDFELYYLKMRMRGWFIITGASIIEYNY